jgi:hypothetical protein
MMKLIPVILAAASIIGATAHRPARAARNISRPVAADSIASPLGFFAGHWSCVGGTPAGRVLVADVNITPAMNNRWLEVRHADRPPGRYQSLSLWVLGAPADSTTTTIVYDNFGGARRFDTQGWATDRIVWVRDTTEAGARMETFTYLHVSDSAYWYAWHVRRTPGAPLVLGDSATCRRS